MLRILAYLFLALAAVIAGADVVSGLMAGHVQLQPLGAWWAWVDRNSLLLLQPAIQRHISPALWDPGILTLLEWPAAIEFAVLGGLFWLADLWRRRRRRPTRPRLRR